MSRPTVRLKICNNRPTFQPGDLLECECSVTAPEPIELQAVETSVIWRTEGKGEEDLGVHFFDRRDKSDVRDGDLGTLYRFKTQLPNSPLSYDGRLIKIVWVIRVCVFYDRGKEMRFDQPFVLGQSKLLQGTVETDSSNDESKESRWRA
jgi:hypothetical protein